jgi:glycosyltransferase involved in cell wall biosynthesis
VKRVLILIKGLGRGGAEQLLVNAATYRDAAEFDYEVAYLLPWKDALVRDLEVAGLAVGCLDGARGVAWIRRLRALVEHRRIDLVHIHSPYPAIGARIGLQGCRVRLVCTEHNVWQRYHRATYWGNALTFPLNDHVFAVSNRVRASIRYPKPLRGRRMPPVETLYHGPDPSISSRIARGDSLREELGIPKEAPVVGTVANFKPHKGYQYLLQAAQEVKNAISDVRFVLVGRGPVEEEMRQKASALGLDGSVIFTGYREDAPVLMRSFDVFVLPSVEEGLSIALLEAMALGAPPIVTNVGGLPEVVDDGKHGIVVPPRNGAALARAIESVLRDENLRERLRRAARERAADFDIRKAVKRMESTYVELLG